MMKLLNTIKAYLNREDESYRENLYRLYSPTVIEEYRPMPYERL